MINKLKFQAGREFKLYLIGVAIITILLILNSLTHNTLSFDLSPSGTTANYTEMTPHLSLPRGTYTFDFTQGGSVIIQDNDGNTLADGVGSVKVRVPRDDSNIRILSSSSPSNVTVKKGLPIFSDTLFIALIIAALLVYIGYIRFGKKETLSGAAVVITLIAIAVYASYPLFENYITFGHDLNFHLYRIEGIKDGLLSGQFPVRLDPTHNNGYGYVTASIYPSLYLYFPALLRLLGVSLVTAYKAFLFAVNLATAVIMYKCTESITKSRYAGVFASVIYTLSTWRIYNMLYRAAIGEMLAMTFFPVVILGLYHIIKGDRSKWWIFALGCSGIFHAHVISCLFTAMLAIVSFIVFFRDLKKDRRYMGIVKAAVLTILLNLWYLIPFITYYRLDMVIQHIPPSMEYFSNAIFPAEMFNFFNDKFGYSQLIPLGIPGNMSLSLGVGITLCFALCAAYFIFDRKKQIKDYGFHAEMFLFAVFVLFMASTLFPSELLQKTAVFNKFANTVYLPWRFLSLASPIICITGGAIASHFTPAGRSRTAVMGIVCIVCCVSFSIFGTAYTTANGAHLKIGQAVPSNGTSGLADEYFIYGTDTSEFKVNDYKTGGGVTISSYEKNGTNIKLEITGAADGSYIEVPLLFYPGYSARDNNHNKLKLEQGSNNILRVYPASNSTEIKIKYSGMLIFKIGCLISLLTLIYMLLTAYTRRKNIDMSRILKERTEKGDVN